MVQFPYGLDASPARSPGPCPTRLPDPPTEKLKVRDGQTIIAARCFFGAPLKMTLFPYGLLDASPARSPDHARSACQTRPRQTGSGRRSKNMFCWVCFVNPSKLSNCPMVLLQTRPAGSSGATQVRITTREGDDLKNHLEGRGFFRQVSQKCRFRQWNASGEIFRHPLLWSETQCAHPRLPMPVGSGA